MNIFLFNSVFIITQAFKKLLPTVVVVVVIVVVVVLVVVVVADDVVIVDSKKIFAKTFCFNSIFYGNSDSLQIKILLTPSIYLVS